MDLNSYWPKSLSHHSELVNNEDSEYILVAEINNSYTNGCKEISMISTALIPSADVNRVLAIKGGIGCEAESWGPHPCVDEDVAYDTTFWINGGSNTDDCYQTIVNSWLYHDKQILMIDNVFLMAYGLTPRYLDNGVVEWDDPSKPVYGVVKIKSLADFNIKEDERKAYIEIRRDYLEDYCFIKNCSAVKVFYEDRWSKNDTSIDSVLKKHPNGVELELPGRRLLLANFKNRPLPQLARVWGSRLLLAPSSSPILDDQYPLLEWPDYKGPYPKYGRGVHMDYCYISDNVLKAYEGKEDYQINPKNGSLNKDTWWGVSYVTRYSRNYLRIELRKLYDGCPSKVIKYWHKFAVCKSVAEQDVTTYGEKHIGIRVEELVNMYLELTESLSRFSQYLEVSCTQKDIGSFYTSDVRYNGWWSFDEFNCISNVFSPDSSKSEFLSRVLKLIKLLENLKESSLRKLLLAIGVGKTDINGLKTFRLLGTLVQILKISKDEKYSIFEDADEIVKLWDSKTEIDMLNSLFSLNYIRHFEAHSIKVNNEFKQALKTFNIGVGSTKSGWGISLDLVIDKLTNDLNSINMLLESVMYD